MILAIETSCDETAAAIVEERRVLANVIYSQVLLHRRWGGVVPSIAKRAHQERIDWVIEETINKVKKNQNWVMSNEELLSKKIEAIAVTQGPGLAIALEVGINKAKELSVKWKKKLIAVNHLEGHIYSPFVQNSKGKPKNDFHFPYLELIVSGGHTELVLFKDHLSYKTLGKTVDDAAGEALDKAAKLLGLGYPGGPVIERLASSVNNRDFYHFPRPMIRSGDLNFSFSGLKTSFYYFLNRVKDDKEKKIAELAASFQQAVFDTLIFKTEMAIQETGINHLLLVGGVSANRYLRLLFRRLIKKYNGKLLFPSFKYLTGDNAAMIGVVASYKLRYNQGIIKPESLDRIPRLSLN
jgi:N6-L-threonylcarbamoyladenine synthase